MNACMIIDTRVYFSSDVYFTSRYVFLVQYVNTLVPIATHIEVKVLEFAFVAGVLEQTEQVLHVG